MTVYTNIFSFDLQINIYQIDHKANSQNKTCFTSGFKKNEYYVVLKWDIATVISHDINISSFLN